MAEENEYEDVEAGEMVELEDEDADVIDTEDGGAIIRLNEEDHRLQTEHFANIADDLDQRDLQVVCDELVDLIGKDKDARKKRDEQYEEGIRRTGLGNDAPGGAAFTGANKVVHPLLTEVCVDFSARVMKELLPPNGPVRTKIVGKTTKDKLAKADRKAAYMNWQLTEQMREFRSELEQLSTQVPLGGVQYMKLFWSPSLQRVESVFVPVDDVYLPFAASNFYTAERRTHVQYITEAEYNKRVKTGMYREVDLGMPDEIEQTKAAKANDKIEGRTADNYNEDGLRTIFEVTTFADFEDDVLPYVITIDKATGKALAVYRNWDPRDENHEALVNMVEFPFLPWRGAYPIGMTHMIGSLSGAATGALRALLDSAHIQNVPTLLKLKGGPGGQNLNPQPTEVTEIDGGTMADDIRKLVMPTPFNGPSPVLFQLLGFLVDAGKGVVQTSFENLSDASPNQPVGTTLALIEQGMVVFSSIHARLHNSMGMVLKVVHRLNSAYLTDEMIQKQFGAQNGDDEDDREDMLVRPEDFDGPMDVIPVSDPNIFSETQRFAQIQAVMQRAQALPMIYDVRKVEELFLKQLKIPDADDLMLPKPEPKDLSPIEENVAASVGKPIGALPPQNHIAHIKVHLAFLQSPMFGMNPVIAPRFLPAMVEHIKDHMLLHYMSMVTKGIDLAEQQGQIQGDDDMQQADVVLQIQQTLEQAIGPQFMQVWGQAFQEAQKYRPPQPMDPNQAAAQVQQMAIQQRSQEAQQRGQIDQAKMQQQAQLEQAKMQTAQQRDAMQAQERQQEMAVRAHSEQQRAEMDMQKEAMRQQAEDQRTREEIEARLAMNREDNKTAKELAAVEVLSGEQIGYSSGTGINPNPTP